MEMTCLNCTYVASGNSEEEVKNKLRQHSQSAHSMSNRDFE